MRRIMLAVMLGVVLSGCASNTPPAIPAPLAQIMQPCPAVVVQDVLWSPDGTRIAYHFDGHTHIQTVPMNERGSVKALNVEARPFEWSQDGSRLLLSSVDGSQIIDADGRNPITLPDGMFLHSYGGSWSPDGSQIAYGRYNGDVQRYELAIWDAASGAITPIYTESAEGLTLLHPAWSPDGTHIAVIASGSFGSGYIRIIPMSFADTNVGVVTIDKSSFLPPLWAPDGKHILVMDWGQDAGIYILSADGADRTRLTDQPAATMRWLPDASGLVAVHIDISTGTESVIRVGLDGEITTLAEITTNGAVSISPDGTRIAFISDELGFDDLYVMNLDGSEKTRLTVNAGYSTCINWPF